VVLGELYNNTGDFDRAVSLYLSALETDSLRQWASEIGLGEKTSSNRKDYLLGLAGAYEGLKEHKKAKQTYLRYLRENPNAEDRIIVFTVFSRIAEKEGMLARSEDYLSLVARETPSEEVVEELGEFRFRLGRYDDAVATFDQAIGITSIEEKQARLSARIIVSLLKMDKVPQAEVRMNVFEQTFKKIPDFEEYQAEFYLEKGRSRIRRKEFDPALEALREVTQKYDDTSFKPEAELETAKVFLITNKIEDALRILTEMPDRYPDHPILAQVYLNLGDHYFRSQQYENALRALRLSLEIPESDVVSVTMRYLIRVYDSLRMWDAAMSFTREYIRRFPDAEDVLQKRVQIGNFYMNLDEYGRAIEVFRDVKKEADAETEAEVQYWIGKCYSSMGNFEQSIFEFMKVAYLSRPTKLPWDTTALYEAGQAYLRLEKPHQARKLFEQIVRREGGASDLGRIARQRIEEIDEKLPDKNQGKS
jgi:tetratricopeptide (TPR) repeat protein